jgi:hypothetical protein
MYSVVEKKCRTQELRYNKFERRGMDDDSIGDESLSDRQHRWSLPNRFFRV